MLTENTQRYISQYLSGQGLTNWVTVSRPDSMPLSFLLADDVAHLQFLSPHLIHFTETRVKDNIDIAFGLLDRLKENRIEAVVHGAIYTLREDDPDRDFHIRNPRSSLTILNRNSWVLLAQGYAFSRDALFSNAAFSSGYDTYKMFYFQSPPGYVDLSLYTDLDTLSSVYKAEGLVIITKEEIERRKQESRMLRYALAEGNVGMLADLLQDVPLVADSLPSEVLTEVAAALVLSSGSNRRNTDEQ